SGEGPTRQSVDAIAPGDAVRLRPHCTVGDTARRRVWLECRCRAEPGGAAFACRAAWQEFCYRGRVRRCRRGMRAVRANARPVALAAAHNAGLARGLTGDAVLLARLVGPLLI